MAEQEFLPGCTYEIDTQRLIGNQNLTVIAPEGVRFQIDNNRYIQVVMDKDAGTIEIRGSHDALVIHPDVSNQVRISLQEVK